jgi:hypothetical protein
VSLLYHFRNHTHIHAPTDTFSNLTYVGAPASDSSQTQQNDYIWSERGIAWPGEAKKYSSEPGYNLSDIVPPPNWMDRFPGGYNETNVPNLHEDEHFQNWMRTAGLPTFTKLWGRNDNDKLERGRYQIVVNMSKCLILPRHSVTSNSFQISL